jgi:hypothetical protein
MVSQTLEILEKKVGENLVGLVDDEGRTLSWDKFCASTGPRNVVVGSGPRADLGGGPMMMGGRGESDAPPCVGQLQRQVTNALEAGLVHLPAAESYFRPAKEDLARVGRGLLTGLRCSMP